MPILYNRGPVVLVKCDVRDEHPVWYRRSEELDIIIRQPGSDVTSGYWPEIDEQVEWRAGVVDGRGADEVWIQAADAGYIWLGGRRTAIGER